MAVSYSKSSPYASSEIYGFFLDVANIPTIPIDPSDVQYQIDAIYNNRPDLLAFDLYGNSSLWWVFSVRNPNVLQDPVFDFVPGVIIFVPQKQNVTTALGL
jgi:alpha-L-fucosidase